MKKRISLTKKSRIAAENRHAGIESIVNILTMLEASNSPSNQGMEPPAPTQEQEQEPLACRDPHAVILYVPIHPLDQLIGSSYIALTRHAVWRLATMEKKAGEGGERREAEACRRIVYSRYGDPLIEDLQQEVAKALLLELAAGRLGYTLSGRLHMEKPGAVYSAISRTLYAAKKAADALVQPDLTSGETAKDSTSRGYIEACSVQGIGSAGPESRIKKLFMRDDLQDFLYYARLGESPKKYKKLQLFLISRLQGLDIKAIATRRGWSLDAAYRLQKKIRSLYSDWKAAGGGILLSDGVYDLPYGHVPHGDLRVGPAAYDRQIRLPRYWGPRRVGRRGQRLHTQDTGLTVCIARRARPVPREGYIDVHTLRRLVSAAGRGGLLPDRYYVDHGLTMYRTDDTDHIWQVEYIPWREEVVIYYRVPHEVVRSMPVYTMQESLDGTMYQTVSYEGVQVVDLRSHIVRIPCHADTARRAGLIV